MDGFGAPVCTSIRREAWDLLFKAVDRPREQDGCKSVSWRQHVFSCRRVRQKEPYGRLFILRVPGAPEPIEQNPGKLFGPAWGGQTEITDRLLQGFDGNLPRAVQEALGISEEQHNLEEIRNGLKARSQLRIPWQFLSLQDCVDMAIFLLRTTITLQQWIIGVRGVGGQIDVATITRIDGFKAVQRKRITSEHRDQSLSVH